MFLLDRLLVGGLGFVLDKVAQVVDTQMDDEDTLRADLLNAQMRRELGEIDEEQFASIEASTLQRLRAALERRRGRPAGALRTDRLEDVEVEVSFGDEERR